LAKPGLLDTARFPTMIFSAGGAAGVTRTGSRELSGTLQARGRTIAVDLRYSTHESAPGRVTVHVVSALDRRELGIKAPALMIGNRVAIDFTAEFERLV
jgi:polyisoprenoid-binding protein YceI